MKLKSPRLLLKKDGGVRADLQHAVDQVRRWLREFEDYRDAALDCLGLTKEQVAKVKGVVIAGRTPNDVQRERILRSHRFADIEFYTYDDIRRSVAEIIKRIATI